MPEIAGQESVLGHRGEAWPMAARDPLERRADLLAATVQAAFGSARAVTATDDDAMRAQVADWLRRLADDDRAGLSGQAGAEPANKEA